MATVLVYSTRVCPYCVRAKQLLTQKGATYTEILIDDPQNPTARDEMLEKSGGQRTVPQIFINDQHIGGSDDLYALERAGKLDALLSTQEKD